MTGHSRSAPVAIVAYGVCGSGKSTFGEALADRLNCRFIEGDDFHPQSNVAKMSAGVALEDTDRWPWLDSLGAAIGAAARRDGIVVVACSALKRSYRDRLGARAGVNTQFFLLDCDRSTLEQRVGARIGHYMPLSLLDSQLATLERPDRDEHAIILDARVPVDKLGALALTTLFSAWE